MEIFLGVILIAIIIWIKSPKGKKTTPSRVSTSAKRSSQKENQELDTKWLSERWNEIESLKKQNKPNIVAGWYFDEATTSQIAKLNECNIKAPKAKLLKGQASDLIGLNQPPEEDEIEILKFFKIPTKGVKQTKARHLIGHLFLSEENKQKWSERPANPIQKECIRYFKIKIEGPITFVKADEHISEHLNNLPEEDINLRTWSAFESAYDELSDKEAREDYGIKKPTTNLLLKTIQTIISGGKAPEEIDTDEIAEHIIESNPEMAL